MRIRTPKTKCPNCDKLLDSAAGVDGDLDDLMPKSGDITICLYCGHIMAFDDQLEFRKLSDSEMKSVAGDKRVLAIQKARGRKYK